ncbi:tRNA (N6-isopentenyl adenosine(37)-C2)-methylthiotransferase MiaB [Butyrivibrio sp. AE2032]|uniref:tRNA (N6-isopentenyl adenosine(37)-C2)-methylthiotransferase MiaB n=1 Tax=Butyrivibrio sp. AE2032 TaxID=1458463 RepID=UPI00055816C2|nr:tRNA (N6-isopentenyl adenosine(37)-C2)-methylthiotransferase MiaB [Butyrivibrio sp. AE2032]
MAIIRTTDTDRQDFDSAVNELKEYFSSLGARKGRTLTYNVLTYGCQLNESDSEKLSGMLSAMGLEASSGGELDDADVIVFNTCSIRENADRHLFGNLGVFKTLKKNDRDVIIAICGCMMKVPENVARIKKSYPYVDLVFDPQQLHRFPVLLRDSIRDRKQLVNISADDYIAEDSFFPIDRKRKFRALVPIMYGCNNFCSYCIVPYARGRERSRDFEEIVRELADLASKGYKEVMLLGQNVNSYKGEGGKTFADILRAASDFKEFSRVRFMSSHPKDLSDEVIDIMAERPNVEKHLHLAMQSGSDRVLREMNRPYTIEKFLKIAEQFRTKVEGGSLTTDIIVGFPGETEEDFEETLKAIETAKFDAAFTFQYSARPGTKAASFENQIPADIVTERFGRLTEYTNRYAEESNLRLVGKTMEVLIEGISKAGDMTFSGRTITNHLVNFTIPGELGIDIGPDMLEGRLCEVRIDHARPYSVDGVLVSIKGE